MSDTIDRGPLDEYEVVWKNGHIDHVSAHQVTTRGGDLIPLMGRPSEPERVLFHGEVDGRWRLLLSAPMDEISVIRNVTHVREDPR